MYRNSDYAYSFFLMFGTVYGGIYQRNIEKDLCKEHREISGEGLHIIPDVAVYTFAGIIGFTYILFIAFQAKYLFLPVRDFTGELYLCRICKTGLF